MGKTWITFFLIFLFIRVVGQNCPVPDAGPDITICEPGQSARIMGSISGSYDRYYWEPVSGLVPPNSLTPTARPIQTTTYRLVVEAKSNTNLIVNGDFAGGNSGFTSDYDYFPPGTPFTGWGQYSVHNQPSAFNGGFSNCSDITGEGMMFIADAGLSPGLEFWCQTVDVDPNTEYEFSFWGTSIYPVSPSIFQVNFNGVPGGGPFANAATPCNWQKYTTRWNSGGNTSVTICLEDLNIELGGNDFAIDDIQLLKICKEYDEVTIEVVEIIADGGGPYELTCADPIIQLDGGLSSQGPGYSYEWTTLDGRILGGSNTLYPTIDRTGTYILTVYGPGGCEKRVAVDVFGNTEEPLVRPQAADSIGCGTDSVSLGISIFPTNQIYIYEWTGPGGFMSNAERPWVFQPGTYYVTVTDIYGCSNTDSVTVPPAPGVPPLRAFYTDTLNCERDSVILKVEPLVNGQLYEWRGPNAFRSDEPEPVVRDTGWYYVITGNDPGCQALDSILVVADLTTSPPAIAGDTLNCLKDTVQVSAFWNGGWAAENWEWRLPNGEILKDTVLQTPLFGFHYLYSEFENGCGRLDSIFIEKDSTLPSFTLVPDTITCQRPLAILSGSFPADALGVSWSGPGNFSSMRSSDTVSLHGTYFALVTGANGCQSLDSVMIERDAEVPTIQLFPDTLNCLKDSALLRWSSQDTGLIFSWTGPMGFQNDQPINYVSEPGTYYLVLRNLKNCEIRDSVEISEDRGLPSFDLATDSINCDHPEAQIQVIPSPGNISIEWFGANGSLGTDNILLISEGGQYRVEVTGENGCSRDSIFQIMEDSSPPELSLQGDTITCEKNEIWARGTSPDPDLEFSWTGGNIIRSNGDSALIGSPGTYTLEVRGKNGCTTTRSITIQADTARPTVFISGDTLLFCKRNSLTLQASGNATGLELVWRDESGNQIGQTDSLVVSSPGSYHLEVRDPSNGCESMTRQVVEQALPPESLVVNIFAPDCFERQGYLEITSINGGSGPYSIDVDGGIFLLNEVRPLSPGSYLISVTDALGCSLDSLVEVPGRTDPVINLTSRITVINGERVLLSPTINIDSGALSMIRWEPSGKVSCPDCLTTFAVPDVSESYVLTIRDSAGCETSAQVYIEVRGSKIFIPNAFTPHNKDGVNDFFIPQGGPGTMIESMEIFDRWGNRIWVRSGINMAVPNEGWDGTSGTRIALPGTYVYRIVFQLADGSRSVQTGDVTVID